jgi:propionate CoA-transferase
MPEGVASVAAEEKLFDFVTLTAEPGIIGGIPQGGLDFGAAINAESIIDQNQMFDFYDGGGLDLACLGMAQVDSRGDVNVSLFNGRLAGAGGFINISQNARELIFAGTFTTGGLKTAVVDGRLKIIKEGKSSKFVDKVDQITFSGFLAANNGQPVLYVTERCVFKLIPDGLELIEVAPGIDVERDILALMGFRPVVRSPQAMDASLFSEALMHLDDRLLNRPLSERFLFDEKRNTLFLGLDGYRVHKPADVEAIREGVLAIFNRIGHRFSAVINYDSVDIATDMASEWFSMAADVERTCYDHVSRYTTSAFMRLKLGDALSRRNVAPHIFETSSDAHQFVVK